MNLRKIVMAMCLGLMASGALAQSSNGWVQLDKRPEKKIGQWTYSVDLFYLPKLNKKGDLVTVSVLNNAESMAGKSGTFDFEFDCKKNIFKIIKGAVYEGKMASGKSQSFDDQLKDLPALAVSDQVFENAELREIFLLSAVRTASLKAIACDGQAVTTYKQTIDALEPKESAAVAAATAAAEAKAKAEQARIKQEEATSTMCGQQTCKSLNRLATSSPLIDSKWIKIESTPERGDLYYDANIVTAKDVDIKVQKSPASMDAIPKKTSIGMSRMLVNLPPSAMAAAAVVLADEWDTSGIDGPKKRDKPLVAKSLVFNYEFDCGANAFRQSSSGAYTELDAKGSLLKTSGFSTPWSDLFESVNEEDGKPRGTMQNIVGASDQTGKQATLTLLEFSPAGLLKTLCSASSGAPVAGAGAVVASTAGVTGAPNSAVTTSSTAAPASAPAAPKSKITEIMTPIGEFQPARGFGGKYWAYLATEGSVYLKEIENTDKSIVLEGYGLQFAIDPVALRMTYTIGTTRKAANIDEAKSSVELHSYTQLKYQGGQLTFQEDPTNGPMNVWILKTSDGATSELVDLGAGDLFYDPVKNIQIAVDLKDKKITFDVKGKKPSTRKITEVTSEVSQSSAAIAPAVATSPAGSKATEIQTSVGSFLKLRGAGGKYWFYMHESGDGWMALKETENTDKAIVLEGYGLKFTIDPIGLRMTYSIGTTRKAVNIDEIKDGASLFSFTELQFTDGQMSFKEDPSGPMDAWLVTPKTGASYEIVDQGWGVLYDPTRNIQVTIDLDEKKLSFDSASKKPSVKKILNFK
jgi:hypothetical protein